MTLDQRPDAIRLSLFTVGDWLVDPKACQLSGGGAVERLRPQLVDLLVCLAKRPGKIVLREEILSEVWSGQYIAESGLSRCVAELRQALRDDAQQPRFIETIPKRGYRLIAPVVWLAEEPSPPTAPDRTVPAEAVPDRAHVGSAAATDARHSRVRGSQIWTGAGLALLVIGVVAGVLLTTSSPVSVLTERDTVLLADVSNATRERVFDDALRLALAVNLEQAPFLRILPREAIRGALVRAGRSPDEQVVGPIALEVCRREGAAVLLAGSITSLGSRYAVGIEAIACGTGESLGHALAEADTRERVLTALEQAASRIRRKLGESRDSLRQHDVPLVRATTPSLEALRALTLGDVRRDSGRYGEALTHYRQATDLDPNFALAWARRGVTARNLDLREEAIPALRRAFELQSRVSQPERFYIEGLYYRLVAGDPQKAIETYQGWRRMYPGSPIPPNAIASTLSDEMGQYETAVTEATEAVRLAPNTSMPYNNLVQALLGTGRFADVKRVVADATSRGLDDWPMHANLLVLALREGDQAAVERETRWGAGDPETALFWLRLRASVAVGGGKLGEARRLWSEAIAKAGETGAAKHVTAVRLERAEAEALVGDRTAARALTEAVVSADRRPLVLVRSAIVWALIGDLARARAVLDVAAKGATSDPAPLRVWLPVAEALVTARQGRAEDALRILQPIARFERGNDFNLLPVCVRALVCLSARRPADAAAALDDIIRLRALASGSLVAFAGLELARALRESGDAVRSVAAYDAFLESWKDADPDAPLLKVARRERAVVARR